MYSGQIIRLIPKSTRGTNLVKSYGSMWVISSVYRGTRAPSVNVYSSGQHQGHNTTATVFVKNDPDFSIQE